jgi:hypothetical protein
MDGTVARIDAAGRVVATIAVGGKPESVAAGEDAVWVATHAQAAGRLTPAQYEAELGRIHDRVYDLARDVLQPILQDRVAVTPRPLDPAIAFQLQVLNDRLAAEIRALSPPGALAGDHQEYLEGLAAMGRLYVRLAEAFESNADSRIFLALSELDSEWIRIRARMPDELRSATVSWPLTGA